MGLEGAQDGTWDITAEQLEKSLPLWLGAVSSVQLYSNLSVPFKRKF